MTDETRHEPPGLSGSQLVERYGEEVRTSIAAGIAAGAAAARTSIARWCVGTIIAVPLMVAGTVYLMRGNEATEFLVHHVGPDEVCTRVADVSDRIVFACKPIP